MDNLVYWLAIKKLPKVGDITFISNLEKYGNIKDVFYFYNLTNFNKDDALYEAEKELDKCCKLNIKILTYNSENYPENLKQIHSPPPILFYYGNIELINSNNIVAIVGSRNPTEYGVNATIEIVKALVKKKITIASGFARGIDTIAHREAIINNGNTIAVLGCGLNIIYPASNRSLFEQIKNNGLIISEFPLDTKPESGNFPKRNRIISGISKAVAVMEAGKKSGTLITAEFALNQGKDLYALPGNIYNYKAKGTNYLIKNGAYLLENANDIIENSFSHLLIQGKNKINDNNKKNFSNNDEKSIYNLLLEAPLNFDELVVKTSISPKDLMTHLTVMEINEYIKKVDEKFYAI